MRFGLAVILLGGLIALIAWAWTANSEPQVYGYVGVEPIHHFDPQHPTTRESYIDWSGMAIEQRSQAFMLTSKTLLNEVMQNRAKSIRDTAWFKSQRNVFAAARWLENHFHADPIPDSKLIKVFVDAGPSPRDAKTIIEDVVNTHLDMQRTLSTNKLQDRSQQLNNIKFKMETRIRELTNRQSDMMLKLRLVNIGDKQQRVLADQDLQVALEHRVQLSTALALATRDFDDVAGKQMQGAPESLEMLNILDTDALVLAVRHRVIDAAAEIAVAKASDTPPEKIAELAKKRDIYLDELAKVRNERRTEILLAKVGQAHERYESSKTAYNDADKRVGEIASTLGDLAIAMQEYQSVTEELTALRTEYRMIKDQLDALSSTSAEAQIDWKQRPQLTEDPLLQPP